MIHRGLGMRQRSIWRSVGVCVLAAVNRVWLMAQNRRKEGERAVRQPPEAREAQRRDTGDTVSIHSDRSCTTYRASTCFTIPSTWGIVGFASNYLSLAFANLFIPFRKPDSTSWRLRCMLCGTTGMQLEDAFASSNSWEESSNPRRSKFKLTMNRSALSCATTPLASCLLGVRK